VKYLLRSIISVFALAVCPVPLLAQSSNPENLSVSFASFGVIYYPHFIAKELGYYRDEGLAVGVLTPALTKGDARPPLETPEVCPRLKRRG